LVARKDFEDEHGFLKYDIYARRDPITEEGGEWLLATNEVMLGLFDNHEQSKVFIDRNPEIRRTARGCAVILNHLISNTGTAL
jgi:hypothetical protein